MEIRPKALRDKLDLAVAKKGTAFRSVTVASSDSENAYWSGSIASDTHLLDISSEQAALYLAVAARDYETAALTTMVEDTLSHSFPSPLVLNILIDYERRVERTLTYTVVDHKGARLFESNNLTSLVPFYNPPYQSLALVSKKHPVEHNWTTEQERDVMPRALKAYAQEGMERYFPSKDSGSAYGASARTNDGTIFFAGGWSSFEHRTNIHPEMGAVITALMNGKHALTDIGVVSTKYNDTPAELCGTCRQFIAEINARFKLDIHIHCFALKNDSIHSYAIEEYLPHPWTSKKW